MIGLNTAAGTVIENVIFEGVVGSAAAVARGGAYEYIGGLIGRADAAASATNVIVLARIYGSGSVINTKGADKLTLTDVAAYDAATQLEEGKAFIEATLSGEAAVEPAAPEAPAAE